MDRDWQLLGQHGFKGRSQIHIMLSDVAKEKLIGRHEKSLIFVKLLLSNMCQ